MQIGERRWTEVQSFTNKVVVVPLGALEQHGHHLPLLTDTMIITELARRAEAQLGDGALFLPTLYIGASDRHRAMPGTVSIGNDHYVSIVEDILESLVGAGFRRIFLLNGHGGNMMPSRQALDKVQMRHRDKSELYMAISNWWAIAAKQIAAIEDLDAKTISHSCEQETSMILCLHPELVEMSEARGAIIPFESAFYCPDFSRPSRVEVSRPSDQLSVTGAFGHPESATAEKGESIFAVATTEIVAFIREFANWPTIRPH